MKALQLLSLESVYPAAGQLGIDMLKVNVGTIFSFFVTFTDLLGCIAQKMSSTWRMFAIIWMLFNKSKIIWNYIVLTIFLKKVQCVWSLIGTQLFHFCKRTTP
ncbi:uncharacterized protein DC041_0010375 [Schistosoma bovis]|uniref:Uncharacterized protein n=1 Tax=Schistosoma bovis TaxID=6184 RepID=A0A430QCP3_SCHBO|nr:uncharacterized protein DC041_0010375 [Schistosoma bovis]